MFEERAYRYLHRIFASFFALYVLIPICVTAVMAFSNDNVIRFPIRGFSLRWFGEFFNDSQWINAAWNSLEIAAMTTVMALVLALPTAYALAHSHRNRPLLQTLMIIPLFVPGLVLGIAVAMGLGSITVFGSELFGSKILVACAHTLWALPLAITVLVPTFETLDKSLVEAAGDLGAPPLRAFFNVIVPVAITGIVSAALFSFITSLNEFIMALFLTTRETQTLPVMLWLSLRSSASPQIAVASFVLAASVFTTIGIAYVWYAMARRK
ncbi:MULTISPECIES: ABC transporter permease [unclassified Hyphomicrobium]|uniref:ABC transporter permease n=1 Tax=unclassified Hyphomicrobium TaxID=2619925 RepID=UPI000213F6FA|nr:MULTISPECIES: ABC transporter permease [unclassified Hyphomicrobium]CCB66806.1 putative Spermidine/putrescine ABC transporter permease protein [Hyphomicrobium sp. MC1]